MISAAVDTHMLRMFLSKCVKLCSPRMGNVSHPIFCTLEYLAQCKAAGVLSILFLEGKIMTALLLCEACTIQKHLHMLNSLPPFFF